MERAAGMNDGLGSSIPTWSEHFFRSFQWDRSRIMALLTSLSLPCRLSMDQPEGQLFHPPCIMCEVCACPPHMDSPDEISESEPVVVDRSSSSNDAVRGPLRRAKSPSKYKYGFCDVHQKAFKLHLVKSGPNTSKLWVRCEMLWHRGSDGKPQCWKGHEYRGSLEEVPTRSM